MQFFSIVLKEARLLQAVSYNFNIWQSRLEKGLRIIFLLWKNLRANEFLDFRTLGADRLKSVELFWLISAENRRDQP